jgi:hypothetical protein
MRFVQTLSANTPITNLLAGSKFEFLPVPSMVEVYAVSDVVAMDTSLELTLGNVIEFDQMIAPFTTVAGGGPNVQDHRIGGGVGAAGDRVVLKVSPVGASVATGGLRVLVIITPV